MTATKTLKNALKAVLEKADDADALEILGALTEWHSESLGEGDAWMVWALVGLLDAIGEGCRREEPQKCCTCGHEETS